METKASRRRKKAGGQKKELTRVHTHVSQDSFIHTEDLLVLCCDYFFFLVSLHAFSRSSFYVYMSPSPSRVRALSHQQKQTLNPTTQSVYRTGLVVVVATAALPLFCSLGHWEEEEDDERAPSPPWLPSLSLARAARYSRTNLRWKGRMNERGGNRWGSKEGCSSAY